MTDHLFDNPSVLVDELQKRGVKFPLGGFAPGLYNGVCRGCVRRFDGAKRSTMCLMCAVAKGLAAAGETEVARREGEEVGYKRAIVDLSERGSQRYGEREKIVIETGTSPYGAGPTGRA